jgi:magnesium transporter
VPREVHPGQIGWADRVRPEHPHPPRTVLFRAGEKPAENPPLEGIGRALAARDAFFFGDFQAPGDEELELLAREFALHPLAIEDVRSRHQRPKIDVYGDQYFLVFYRITSGTDGAHILIDEVDFFIGAKFLLIVHAGEMPFLSEALERYCRQPEPHDVSGLLYEILDALVDDYFPLLDSIAERSEAIESSVFEKFDPGRLQALFDLKRDLALLRRIVAPERDAINVLLRRDPPVLDPNRIPYYQDVYDHLIRISDSTDSYRELLTGSLDAFLSVENNRLSEIVRRLTIISTIFMPLTFVTGFWGMNFQRTTGTGDGLFYGTLALMAVLPPAMPWLLRRSGFR